MNTKLIFCVWCPPYLEWSGGSLALHTLVHLLAEQGFEAYVVGCHKSDKLKGGLITEDRITDFIKYNNDRVVMIYPEVVRGNIYGAKNVVWWLLNNPAVTIGETPDYPIGDLVFTFCDFYSGTYAPRIAGELSVFDFRNDTYVDKGMHIKGKTCYTVRKGFYKERNQHPEDAIQILDYQDQQLGEDLIKIFDECETFISYDHNTFLSIHAAMRGCISIVVPDPNISKEEWRGKAGFMKYGIAYGFDDIDYAIETRNLLREYLIQEEHKSNRQLEEFINICCVKF